MAKKPPPAKWTPDAPVVHSKPKKAPSIENLPPRTKEARKAVILMNKLKHRPKSVIIQTKDEVVIQVRGDFAALVKKLGKVFGAKGKDSSIGGYKQHDWKFKGLGFITVIRRSGFNFQSVRFLNLPDFGIKHVEEEPIPTPVPTPVPAVAATPSVDPTAEKGSYDDVEFTLD